MKTSKFLKVLIPSTSQSTSNQVAELSDQSKRKNIYTSSEVEPQIKRPRVIVHIPNYTPDSKHSNRSNQINHSSKSKHKSEIQSKDNEFSSTDNSGDDEDRINSLKSHPSPSTPHTTTVSLSRPQSPTITYDSDFNPNHSVPSSDDEDQSDIEPDPNQHQLPAVMAPITFQRFKKYFRLIKLADLPKLDPTVNDDKNEDRPINENLINQPINQDLIVQSTPNHITWPDERPMKTSERGEHFYPSVNINQTILNSSQVVLLKHNPLLDLNQFKISGLNFYSLQSVDDSSLVESKNHFFRIESLFERDRKKFFHGIRLQQAKDTFVGQSADEFELFLIDQCFELEISLIHQIIDVQFVFSDEKMISSIPFKGYHCRFRWLPTDGSFLQLKQPPPPLLTTSSGNHSLIPSPSALCRRCIRIPKEIDWIRDPTTHQITLGPDDRHLSFGFIINGTETYRLWDHVRFIRNSSTSSTTSSREEIGQIIEISGIKSNLKPSIDLTGEAFKPASHEITRLETLMKTKSIKLLVKVYSRKPWLGTRNSMNEDEFIYLDDRRIWITDTDAIVDGLNALVGKCQITHYIPKKDEDDHTQYINLNDRKPLSSFQEQIQEIRSLPNRFYSILPTQAQQNFICSVPVLESISIPYLSVRNQVIEGKVELKELVKDYGKMKLRHLELFGGIGSFSLGFSECGLTDEKSTMFIDWSIPACETVATNYPTSKVFCADVNDILLLMITGKTRCGKTSVKDSRTGDQILRDQLPRPGDFDLITAGFPCGAHSTLNVVRKGEDSKNALCGTALSFVEFLKPTYVYFENVRGLLKSQLNDLQSQEVLTHAFLRLICGTLTTLDYQLQFGVLQAAQYGTPQERRRFILASVKRGFTLPRLPEPTHFYPDSRLQIKLPEQNKITIDFRNKLSRGTLNAITVGDTISDLPLFEYRNPQKIIREFDRRTRIKLTERSRIFPLLNGSSNRQYMKNEKANHDWVGFKRFFYRIQLPKNNFQTYLRSKRIDGYEEDGHQEVRNWHVTGRFSEMVIEQIWHIPMKEGADYKKLPKELRYKDAEFKPNKNKDYSRDFEGNFGRLGYNQLFRTMITRMDPRNQGRTGQVLHPSQHRVLSVLEAQRAQGFPDWFVLSNMSEGVLGLYKQIGNTIPVPITRALGICLWEAREVDWKLDGNRLDEELNGLILLDLMEIWNIKHEESS